MKRVFFFILVDDEDLDDDEEDDADGHDCDVDCDVNHSSRACHQAAGGDSDSDIDMDDVSTVMVADLCVATVNVVPVKYLMLLVSVVLLFYCHRSGSSF